MPKNKRLFFFSYQDFDSKKLMENKHNVIGNILNNVADQAETFANNIGLFSAIDSVVQGMYIVTFTRCFFTVPNSVNCLFQELLPSQEKWEK